MRHWIQWALIAAFPLLAEIFLGHPNPDGLCLGEKVLFQCDSLRIGQIPCKITITELQPLMDDPFIKAPSDRLLFRTDDMMGIDQGETVLLLKRTGKSRLLRITFRKSDDDR
ncbi:MAG: hypothetical protein A2293_10790 [Elusimicrobia bacterium RIFOXYB2_FULL_49_7]|nr:MAG: hypothetical protein A2293_10790 [Elusimicrobia bacterium RIFOXYB2_FULL_49_7]